MALEKKKLETSTKRSASTVTMFERHHLKALNLGLFFYLCFGAILFDSLSFEHKSAHEQHYQLEEAFKQAGQTRANEIQNQNQNQNKSKPSASLEELRLSSVRRMWNITNQLNILYESNWTLLVLDELVEFERQLVKALVGVAIQQQDDEQEGDFELPDIEADELLDENDAKKNSKSSELAKSAREARRSRSIKRSIVHSLATITTIGSPQVQPQNRTAKLATMLYAALGIPLLFYSVAQTGKQLAHSTQNTLLTLRHYCFSLPIHYLCCACNPYLCFRWLSWCCCCCCCSYLFCPSDNKTKCCDTRRAPKLSLRRRRRSKSRRARELAERRDQAAYVIKVKNELSVEQMANRRDINSVEPSREEKSVRFMNRSTNENGQFTANQHDQDDEDYYSDEDEQFYSLGLVLTSVFIFALYFSLGAYVYSRHLNTSLIEASFACYSLLSTSKLPDSFVGSAASDPSKLLAPTHLYDTLKSKTIKTPKRAAHRESSASGKLDQALSNEGLILQSIYLICGLNLISMCVHFAKSWATGRARPRWPQREESASESEPMQHLSNGQVPAAYLSGSFEAGGGAPFLGASPQYNADLAASGVQIQNQNGQHYATHRSTGAPVLDQRQLASASIDISPSQHSEQLNLAELYVVNNNGQQQIASDMSYTSDRSTDRGSLCVRHQAAVQSLPMNGNGAPETVYCGPPATIYTQQPKKLYLANSTGTRQHALTLHRDYGLEEADDEVEMERMLKSCMNGSSKMRQSSSLVQLSHQAGSMCPQVSGNGYGATGDTVNAATLNRLNARSLRPIEMVINGAGEQDGSLNTLDTTSNTASSVSSRTVKLSLPRRQQLAPNEIGFILDENK